MILELAISEELGLFERGKSFSRCAKGATTIKGRLPINPSGGLKSKGHPVGATGVSQMVELGRQLEARSRQGRQVEDPGVRDGGELRRVRQQRRRHHLREGLGGWRMSRPIAVVAFGGNAILRAGDDGSFHTQMEKAKGACRQMLEEILHKGYELVLVHGNGPQVGNLLLQFEKARDIIPVPPLDVAVATSQGLLGHMLEIAMRTVLEEDKMQREVATVLTPVAVNPADPAYKKPTKPIGPFYTRDQAERLRRERWVGGSSRTPAAVGDRVVCSPEAAPHPAAAQLSSSSSRTRRW